MTTTTANRRAIGKVRPADTRRHHRTLLLQHLVDQGPTTRADLARETGLTRVTVSDLVAEMLQESLVDDIGARPGTHLGKPATLVAISESAPVIVAVDLSDDSGFDGAVVDLHGRVLLREQAPFSRGADAVDDVSRLVSRLVERAPRRVLGIGVGTPGIIDDEAGIVLQAPNLAWEDVPLAATLAERHGLPLCVGNDANIAAVAEGAFGDGDDAGLLMVTIGQGVGGGILVDGHPVAGPLRSAGEIGHIVVDPAGAACACGNRGCLETLLSAPALRAAGSDADRSHVGDLLGSVLTPIVTTLGIADVVLHGPTDLLDGPVLDAARAAVARQSLPFVAQRIRIRLVAHDELVLTGAAALVRHRELGVV